MLAICLVQREFPPECAKWLFTRSTRRQQRALSGSTRTWLSRGRESLCLSKFWYFVTLSLRSFLMATHRAVGGACSIALWRKICETTTLQSTFLRPVLVRISSSSKRVGALDNLTKAVMKLLFVLDNSVSVEEINNRDSVQGIILI
jgi:hypothetical protein